MTQTLILGGTAWLGGEIAKQAMRLGENVTCLARGDSGATPQGATFVQSDRRARGAYGAVTGKVWDKVIELSFEPDLVTGALDALASSTKHWTLISSVSVYASNAEPGADESAALVEPSDLSNYAHAKVAAEQASMEALDDRLLIARPGLISGPGDPSNRFGYWVTRLALAKDMPALTPENENRFVQIIDVRDLAHWLIGASTQGLTGIYNTVGREHDLSTVLSMASQTAGHTGGLISATDEWLIAHDVKYWSGPRSLPLWLPRSDTAFAQRSRERFLNAGGKDRDLAQTLHDVLADEHQRGLARNRQAGLTRDEETYLLAELNGN